MDSENASISTPVTEFKAFLSERPVVKEVLYRLRSQSSVPTDTDAEENQIHVTQFTQDPNGNWVKVPSPHRARENVQMNLAGWQHGAFFLRSIRSEEEADELIKLAFDVPCYLVGKVGEDGYHENHGIVCRSSIHAAADPTMGVVRISEQQLDNVLSFGVFGAKTGSFKWEGDSFEADLRDDLMDSVVESNVRFAGPDGRVQEVRSLSADEIRASQPPIAGSLVASAGLPKRLLLPARGFVCDYEYAESDYLGHGIPNKISVSRTDGELHQTIEILRISVQTESLSKEHFLPERFIDPNVIAYARKSLDHTIHFDDPESKRAYIENLKRHHRGIR